MSHFGRHISGDPRSIDAARASEWDDAGVDRSLIREYLALTPLERLRALENAVRMLQKFDTGKKSDR